MNKPKSIGYRPTWAEINLGNLAHNFRQIRKLMPEGKIMVCVKADAYGHGIIPVSRKLVACGADYLGVASIDEGIRLRREKIKAPVLILGLIMKEDIAPVFKYNLIPTVCTAELALALNNKAGLLGLRKAIHIKIDTGMGRIGSLYDDAFGFIKKVYKLKNLDIEGVFTHLACADVNNDFTLHQIELFDNLVSKLYKAGIHIPLVHAANSMGVISYQNSHFNMVRPGLVIYGLHPRSGLNIDLKPVLSLKTRVVYAKKVPKGYGISYGHSYVTKSAARIVTLPIGYGDGYPRNLSNLAPVLIKGRKFKISGRICMDQIMVDVGDSRVRVGDEVVLIGRQGSRNILTEELARLSGTIPYEIVCGLGSRIPRVYL
ncbi:MAG: alanine racemase [Candidatus Omnitrophica bacterium]|nr:alanine racemase [Candidatus Omnitrophota bacterium]